MIFAHKQMKPFIDHRCHDSCKYDTERISRLSIVDDNAYLSRVYLVAETEEIITKGKAVRPNKEDPLYDVGYICNDPQKSRHDIITKLYSTWFISVELIIVLHNT